jgi:hypothetical protein
VVLAAADTQETLLVHLIREILVEQQVMDLQVEMYSVLETVVVVQVQLQQPLMVVSVVNIGTKMELQHIMQVVAVDITTVRLEHLTLEQVEAAAAEVALQAEQRALELQTLAEVAELQLLQMVQAAQVL